MPAFVSVAVLVRFVNEPPTPQKPANARFQIHWRELRYFLSAFWAVVVVGAVFTRARFSEAFLILRASGLGLETAYVPLTITQDPRALCPALLARDRRATKTVAQHLPSL